MSGFVVILLLICGLTVALATVLVLSAVIVSGRADRIEESEGWWGEEE